MRLEERKSKQSEHAREQTLNLVFPGLFRGVLDARASRVTEGMKIAAAHAIAGLIPASELHSENILPLAFDSRVRDAVASAVAQAARADGVARV